MIFYFSGTGNSLWVAKQLAKAFDEPLIAIAEELQKEEISYTLSGAEKLFFVYPVHSWGPAVLVNRFIDKMKIEGYSGQQVYSVCTCGDEAGQTNDMIRKRLAKKGMSLTAGYSMIMPNNYILMKGFNTDSKEVEAEKLSKAPDSIAAIIATIRKGDGSLIYQEGSRPALKSKVIYPLFVTFAMRRNKFHSMDVCNSCGLCSRVCPTCSITMEDGQPEWNNSCVQCLACIHRCPMQAIEYGQETWKKGRYHHPEL